MMLLRVLILESSLQVPRSHVVVFVYKFIKFSAVPQVKSGIDLCAKIDDSSYEADTFQNNPLKDDNLIVIPFLTLYNVELRRLVQDNNLHLSHNLY